MWTRQNPEVVGHTVVSALDPACSIKREGGVR